MNFIGFGRIVCRSVIGIVLACVVALPTQAQDAAAVSPGDLVGTWTAEEDYFKAVLRMEAPVEDSLAVYIGGDDILADPNTPRRRPFSSAEIRGDSLFVTSDEMQVQFRGEITRSPLTVSGTWEQQSQSATITLTREDE